MAGAKKTRGLGRGLDILLGPEQTSGSEQGLQELPITQLQAGVYQPRSQMDEGALFELAQSIKNQGVMQPILVRPVPATALANTENGVGSGAALAKTQRYEIIAGERRFQAAKIAELERIPVLVRAVSDEDAAIMALIENIQRENLNPLEEAQGMQRLIKEFGFTHEQVAQTLGRSRSASSNLLRLLQLAEPVQVMLQAGDLDMGHARALLALGKAQQITAANQIVGRSMSVRETERLVKKMGEDVSQKTDNTSKASKSQDLLRVEERLSDLLASTVEVRIKKGTSKGKKARVQGELAIAFASLDALNGLVERLEGISGGREHS